MMLTFERTISGLDGSEATLSGYVIGNNEEVDPYRRRPAMLVFPGGGYEMVSEREAEPIALKMLGFGFNAFVLRYSVAPSRYPVALIEAAEAMQLIRANADEWHTLPDAVVAAGFSAGGHLAANLATSASDGVLREHDFEPDDVRPSGLMLAYPVITSGEYAHRGSFDALLGEKREELSALDAVSIELFVDELTPPTFLWHTVPDQAVPIHNSLLYIDACARHGVEVEAHFFERGCHGLSLGTQETAWDGINGIEPCVQHWPELFDAWMERHFIVKSLNAGMKSPVAA